MTINTADKIVTMEEIKINNKRHRWFQSPLLLPAIAILAGLFWLAQNGKILGIRGPLFLVLLAQVIFFILMLRRPIWAVAALIVGQLTACNFMLPIGTAISLRLLWALPAFLLVVGMIIINGKIKLGKQAGRIVIPAIIFFVVAAISNYVNTDMSITLQYLRTNIPAFLILLLLPATVENEEDLKRLAIVVLITCSVSAVFAVLQTLSFHFPIPSFSLSEDALAYNRVAGLSESSIQLAWVLPMALLPIVVMYFGGNLSNRIKKLMILLAIVISTALFFTYTRSGLYSLIPGIFIIGIMMKGKLRIRFFLVILILLAAFGLFVSTSNNRYSESFGDDASSSGRLVLWQAGINIALDHPVLGIGAYQFMDVSTEYASTINPSFLENPGSGKALGRVAAHDDFITIWSSFGTVAMLAFLWVFVSIFRNFMESYRRSKSPFLRSISLGCVVALLALMVNMATHNVMDSTILLWIVAGFSIATVKIASSNGTFKAGKIR